MPISLCSSSHSRLKSCSHLVGSRLLNTWLGRPCRDLHVPGGGSYWTGWRCWTRWNCSQSTEQPKSAWSQCTGLVCVVCVVVHFRLRWSAWLRWILGEHQHLPMHVVLWPSQQLSWLLGSSAMVKANVWCKPERKATAGKRTGRTRKPQNPSTTKSWLATRAIKLWYTSRTNWQPQKLPCFPHSTCSFYTDFQWRLFTAMALWFAHQVCVCVDIFNSSDARDVDVFNTVSRPITWTVGQPKSAAPCLVHAFWNCDPHWKIRILFAWHTWPPHDAKHDGCT